MTGPQWPANFQRCTLTGQYLGLDGIAVVGKVTLAARPVALIDYDAEIVILPRALTVTLDATGSFSIQVPATDDPDISPVGWTYQVTEGFVGGRSYDIAAPMGQTVDITRAAPVPAAVGDPIVRGPAGLPGGAQSVQGQPVDEDGNVDLSGVVPVYTTAGWAMVHPEELRDALGLGSSATHDDSEYSLATEYGNALRRNLNLQDLTNAVQARANIGLSVAAIQGFALPPGTMMPFAGAAAPTGYLLAQGQAVSRNTYDQLFAAIGTTYGGGDGATTFTLPDMRGRVPVGAGTATGAAGATAHTLGQKSGEETHTLLDVEIPEHSHPFPAQLSLFSTGGASGAAGENGGQSAAQGNTGARFYHPMQVAPGQFTGENDGDGPHNNMQPYVVTNYLIKT